MGQREAERGDVGVTICCPAAVATGDAAAGDEVVGGGDLVKLERVVDSVLPGATQGTEWKKKRKLVCSAEELRRIMGGLCEEWL